MKETNITHNRLKGVFKRLWLIPVLTLVIGIAFVVVSFMKTTQATAEMSGHYYSAEVMLSIQETANAEKSTDDSFVENRKSITDYLGNLYSMASTKSRLNQTLKEKNISVEVETSDALGIAGSGKLIIMKVSSKDKTKAITLVNAFADIAKTSLNGFLQYNSIRIDESADSSTVTAVTVEEGKGLFSIQNLFIVVLFFLGGVIIVCILAMYDKVFRDKSDLYANAEYELLGTLDDNNDKENEICKANIETVMTSMKKENMLFSTINKKNKITSEKLVALNKNAEVKTDIKNDIQTWKSVLDSEKTVLFVSYDEDLIEDVQQVIDNYHAGTGKKLYIIFCK